MNFKESQLENYKKIVKELVKRGFNRNVIELKLRVEILNDFEEFDNFDSFEQDYFFNNILEKYENILKTPYKYHIFEFAILKKYDDNESTFADLYKAKDRYLEHDILIKTFNREKTKAKLIELKYDESDEEYFYQKFQEEMRKLAKLTHENIVHLYFGGKNVDGNPFYAMEYIEGVRVDEYLRDNPDDIDHIFKQIIEAFYYLRKMEVLHRDIAERNIMVTEEGVVKLIDFGLLSSNNNGEKTLMYDKGVNRTFSKEEWDRKYTYQTEVWYIGKIMQKLSQNNLSFSYTNLVSSMVIDNENERPNIDECLRLISMPNLAVEISDRTRNFFDYLESTNPYYFFVEKPKFNYVTLNEVQRRISEKIVNSISSKEIYDWFLDGVSQKTGEVFNEIEKVNLANFKNAIEDLMTNSWQGEKSLNNLIHNSLKNVDVNEFPF